MFYIYVFWYQSKNELIKTHDPETEQAKAVAGTNVHSYWNSIKSSVSQVTHHWCV